MVFLWKKKVNINKDILEASICFSLIYRTWIAIILSGYQPYKFIIFLPSILTYIIYTIRCGRGLHLPTLDGTIKFAILLNVSTLVICCTLEILSILQYSSHLECLQSFCCCLSLRFYFIQRSILILVSIMILWPLKHNYSVLYAFFSLFS